MRTTTETGVSETVSGERVTGREEDKVGEQGSGVRLKGERGPGALPSEGEPEVGEERGLERSRRKRQALGENGVWGTGLVWCFFFFFSSFLSFPRLFLCPGLLLPLFPASSAPPPPPPRAAMGGS